MQNQDTDAAALIANATIETLLAHRSIRRFTNETIPDPHIRAAVVAGQAASTSSAVQSYCIIRVTNRAKREALIELTGGQAKVAEAGAFFVVCGDTRRHRLIAQRTGTTYDSHLEGFLLAVIDATLFAQNFVIALESLDYGICYIGGLRNQLFEAASLLAVPHGVYPLYGLCAGVAAETPLPRPRLAPEAVMFDDAYPGDQAMRAMIDEYDARYRDYLRERGSAPERIRLWSELMAQKFSEPRRADLAAFYAAQGADLS